MQAIEEKEKLTERYQFENIDDWKRKFPGYATLFKLAALIGFEKEEGFKIKPKWNSGNRSKMIKELLWAAEVSNYELKVTCKVITILISDHKHGDRIADSCANHFVNILKLLQNALAIEGFLGRKECELAKKYLIFHAGKYSVFTYRNQEAAASQLIDTVFAYRLYDAFNSHRQTTGLVVEKLWGLYTVEQGVSLSSVINKERFVHVYEPVASALIFHLLTNGQLNEAFQQLRSEWEESQTV